ncbi:hypothetical protein AXA27_004399 [Escherichia coli]|nr:hypothetical protein [Escherichia coli]EFJ8946742.1 hypothetical protein [Escherichia coli]EIH8473794.1 hypothetical protein [Escherichia coli]
MINFLIGFLIEIKVLVLKIKIDKASHVLSRAMLSKEYSKDFNDKCKTVRKKLLAFYDKDLKQPSNYRNAEYMLDEAMVLCNKFNYLVEKSLITEHKRNSKSSGSSTSDSFFGSGGDCDGGGDCGGGGD